MIYILLIAIVALLILELRLRESFAAPSVILLLSFLMAGSLILVNYRNWDVVLHFKFMVYVQTAIISFLLSTHLTRYLYRGIRREKKSLSYYKRIAKPSLFLMSVVTIAFLIYVVLYLRRNGFSANLTALLSNTYANNVSSNGNSGGFIDNQMLKIVTAIAYISFYQFLLAKYVVKVKGAQIINYYNITVFLFTAVLSTDRNILLRFFIYGFVLWIMFFLDTKKGYVKNINFKIIRKAIVYGVFAMGLFYLVGQTKGYTSNLQRVIGIYGGSGLYNFNLYIEQLPKELLWGNATLTPVKLLVETLLGLSNNPVSIFYDNIAFKSSTGFVYISNIYSAMRPFVQDFGYFGVILFPFILGSTFEFFYGISRTRPYGFAWIYYAYIIYSVAYFSIAEQFFARIHLGSIYEIFWLIVFYLYILRKVQFKVR